MSSQFPGAQVHGLANLKSSIKCPLGETRISRLCFPWNYSATAPPRGVFTEAPPDSPSNLLQPQPQAAGPYLDGRFYAGCSNTTPNYLLHSCCPQPLLYGMSTAATARVGQPAGHTVTKIWSVSSTQRPSSTATGTLTDVLCVPATSPPQLSVKTALLESKDSLFNNNKNETQAKSRGR